MRVAIIGAGMAGLAAAKRLSESGHEVTLFEKSKGIGGRVATRRLNGCVFDHGAQVIKSADSTLAHLMQNDLDTTDLIQVLAPTCLYRAKGEIVPSDPARQAEKKFTYRYGLTTLPKLILNSISCTLVLETRIGRMEETTEEVKLWDENDNTLGNFDSVILTAPAPQSADLLSSSLTLNEKSKQNRIEALRSVVYNPCLTVLLGYDKAAPPPPAYALLAEDRTTPLLWLAFEETKAPERAPDGEKLLIAQLGPAYSKEHYGLSEKIIYKETLGFLRENLGESYARPLWHGVKRWRYSQPHGMVSFETVNAESGRILVCGDALRPENGRVHQAYESGLEAASRLIGQ